MRRMNRYLAWGCLLALAARPMALAEEPPAPAQPPPAVVAPGPSPYAGEPGTPAPGETPELWFPVGEEFTYRIFWGVVGVGRARMRSQWINHEGRWLIRLQLRTKTNKVLSTLFPVDDLHETFVDPLTFLPLSYEKSLKEGRYRCHELTLFDHEKGEASWTSLRSGKVKTYPIEADTRDLLAFMYAMRQHRFEAGQRESFRVMADEKIYDLEVVGLKEERTKVGSYGRVKALKVEPVASFDGLFVRKGRGWMWIAQDERRLAVRVEAEVPVAKVHLVLSSVTGPGEDAWVKENREKADGDGVFFGGEYDRPVHEKDEEQKRPRRPGRGPSRR